MIVYIVEEETDDNENRNMIYRFVVEHPGTHFNAIKRALRMDNGVLQYHLDVLIRMGRIKYSVVGNRKVFFPVGYNPHNIDRRTYIINEIRRRYNFLSPKERVIFDRLIFDGPVPLEDLITIARVKKKSHIRHYLRNIEKKMGVIIKLYNLL